MNIVKSETRTKKKKDFLSELHNWYTLSFRHPLLSARVSIVYHGFQVAFSTVHIQLLDANDHNPEFSQDLYKLTVSEDAKIGLKFGDIKARDADSNSFGEITYYLRGFGSEKFRTDPKNGNIYVNKALDYETQHSYSLSIVARDGGGKVSSASLMIELEDVNDNDPLFEQSEYSRIIRESATSFDPQMFVRATDADGPTQGAGRVSYSISNHNSMNDNVFQVFIYQ